MVWKTYDRFEGKELNKELWEVKLGFPPECIRLEVKDKKLIMEATSAKEGLGIKVGKDYMKKLGVWEPQYVGEAVRIVAKNNKIKGIQAVFQPCFSESWGNGNIHLRGVTPSFCYLIGINYKYDERKLENSDVFLHIWDRRLNSYLPVGGRIHYKDIIPELPQLNLGLEWTKDGFYYRIGSNIYPYHSPVNSLDKIVKEDSKSIFDSGVEFWDIKIDIFGKKPTKIKAEVSNVRVNTL